MHPRVSLHQVAFMGPSGGDTAAFLGFCGEIDVAAATLVTPVLFQGDETEQAEAALAATGVRAATINHVFANRPDLAADDGAAARSLLDAIALTARLGGSAIYLLTGGRGSLDWEGAAARFAERIAPCLEVAATHGIALLVENANAFNADIHIAHTLADTIRLAEIAGIGVCIDLPTCWAEGGLRDSFRRAAPRLGLVQVGDYVLGDRATPCRAVPGDGAVPLERLIGDLLDQGYTGLFDLELVGPRIEAEGARAACRRAAERLSGMLERWGA